MLFIKNLLSQYYSQTCIKPLINPHQFLSTQNHANSTGILNSLWISLSTQKPISTSAQSETPTSPNSQKSTKTGKNNRPLDVMFKEALGLCKRSESMGSEDEGNGDEYDEELRKKLWELEVELRQLKVVGSRGVELGSSLEEKLECGIKSKPTKMVAHFGNMSGAEKGNVFGKRDGVVLKEVSPDMEVLLRHLYDQGYFKGVNFLPNNEFDVSYFDNAYARDFLKFAVEKFGEDHQEIAKCP